MSAFYLTFHKNITFSKILIRLEDSNLFAARPMIQSAFNYKGIEVLNDEHTIGNLMYSVEMMQEIYVKEDKTKSCFDYPKDFTYNDCDRQHALARLAKEIKPGFTPLWTTDNLSSVTAEPVFVNENGRNTLTSFTNGFKPTDCQLPCNRVFHKLQNMQYMANKQMPVITNCGDQYATIT